MPGSSDANVATARGSFRSVVTPPTDPTTPVPSAERLRWFAEEVQPHDRQLKAYLRSSFPAFRDVDDLVQESYLRIWKARAIKPIISAKAFLFRVARNIAVDRVRRNQISPIQPVGDLAALRVIDESSDIAAKLALHEKASLLSDALATLPPRAREVIILCKLQGLSHREAASRLGIAGKTVDEHMIRGLKRLSDELRRRGHEDLFSE